MKNKNVSSKMQMSHSITKFRFGILSPNEIRSMAVCKVENTKLTGPGSVYDPRMGELDTTQKCVTCNQKKDCWGHFGYIELNEPILHPQFYKAAANFLKCFCKKCYRFILKPEQIELAGFDKIQGWKRFERIKQKLKKAEVCAYCRSQQPVIKFKAKEGTIVMERKQKKEEESADPEENKVQKKGKAKKKDKNVSVPLSMDDIKKVFDNISDDDVRLLGLDPSLIHPRNLILTVFPVIPPCSRPYVMADGNICDDDLTYQLIEIIKINNELLKVTDEQKRQKLIQTLKFRIATMFSNSGGKAKHPTDNRPLKGIKDRLAGKEGRMRSNLMGKRVDFSGRTVIGAEPTLKINQLGVPLEMCKILTKPENVTRLNIDWLTDLVNSGQANFVISQKKTGETIRINLQYAMQRKGTELMYGDLIIRDHSMILARGKNGKIVSPTPSEKVIKVVRGDEPLYTNDRVLRNGEFIELKDVVQKKKVVLNIGDVVERHLMKGDVVLLNRQPTLHKGGMLAMEVVPMAGKTLRFNLAVCKSFNADFD